MLCCTTVWRLADVAAVEAKRWAKSFETSRWHCVYDAIWWFDNKGNTFRADFRRSLHNISRNEMMARTKHYCHVANRPREFPRLNRRVKITRKSITPSCKRVNSPTSSFRGSMFTVSANPVSNPIRATLRVMMPYLLLEPGRLVLEPVGFALGPRSPVGVVDGGVFEQSGEHEDETHDKVDVDRFHVRDARQWRPYTCTDGRHRQNGSYTCKSISRCSCFIALLISSSSVGSRVVHLYALNHSFTHQFSYFWQLLSSNCTISHDDELAGESWSIC